jgi:hypothetical protein
MVRWVLGDQLGGASRGVTKLARRRQVGRDEAGGEVARDPGSNPGSQMVEEGGGGRYRWLVRRQSMKR